MVLLVGATVTPLICSNAERKTLFHRDTILVVLQDHGIILFQLFVKRGLHQALRDQILQRPIRKDWLVKPGENFKRVMLGL